MTPLRNLVLACVLSILGNAALAQMEANRFKIDLAIEYSGKKLVTTLGSVNLSLNRYDEHKPESETSSDSSKKLIAKSGSYASSFYLNMDTKSVSDDMLRVISKKSSFFNGVITIKDTYGKLPDRTIKFAQASVTNFSDQYTAAAYGDYVSNFVFSITCKEISINGITIEQ
jgi:hypothetical protein